MSWQNLTEADLEAMGITLDDFEMMMEEGNNPFATDYESMGILAPTDISSQATQWDVLDAQKMARETARPPRYYERQQDRSFYGQNPESFTYDIINQANPYLRALLNSAISGSEPGPNQAMDVREFVTGRYSEDEAKQLGGKKGVREGKTRIGQAAREALGDFDYIADAFHSEDKRWATTDEKERLALLKDWLSVEAEGALAGGAPSVARNVAFSDWAMNRDEGEPFQYDQVGFDRAPNAKGQPRIQTDERYFGKNRAEGMTAQMSLNDFRRAYRDSLANQLGDEIKAGQRIDDPERGGYWVINNNVADMTPLQKERARQQRNQRRSRVADENRRFREKSRGGGDSVYDTFIGNPARGAKDWVGDRLRWNY